MPPKDVKIGRMNGRYFVHHGDRYQPLPHIYEVEEEIEEEPMPWPKENPHLIKRAVDAFCEAIPQIVQAFVDVLPIIKAFADEFTKYPNRRVLHLATRHPDPLVRKKNMKRIARYYRRRNAIRGREERSDEIVP